MFCVQFQQKMHTFEWTINDFCDMCNDNIKGLKSKIFFPFGENQLALYLSADATKSESSENILTLHLHVADSTPLESEWNICTMTDAELAGLVLKQKYTGKVLQIVYYD